MDNNNNQFNQAQFGGMPNFNGQPMVNPNNQFNQAGANPNYQYNQGQMYQGQPQMGYQNYQQPQMNVYGNYMTKTKSEFFKNGASSSTRTNIISSAVMMYISFVITFVVMFMMNDNYGALIDCAVLIALGLCVHLLQSRIAGVIALAYGIFNVFVMYVLTGQFGGWLILLAGICACIGTFKLESEYKQAMGRR